MNLEKDQTFITLKDHSVSGEVFRLKHNAEWDILYTDPKPEGAKLASYYESENYISHTDGKRSLFEKAYQFVKRIALKNKLQLIHELHPKKGKLLDIGAGTGDFLANAVQNGWKATGIEPSLKAKEIALSKAVNFAETSHELLSNSFDIITMWHVLEHVPDLDAQISELKRLIKPDGTIVIAVPNFKSHDARIYGEYWAAYDVPRHLWHFSKTAIEKAFAKHGLKLQKVLPMRFDAFYVCLLSEKYRTGHMNPLKAMYNGLISNYKAKKTQEFSSHIYVLQNYKQ